MSRHIGLPIHVQLDAGGASLPLHLARPHLRGARHRALHPRDRGRGAAAGEFVLSGKPSMGNGSQRDCGSAPEVSARASEMRQRVETNDRSERMAVGETCPAWRLFTERGETLDAPAMACPICRYDYLHIESVERDAALKVSDGIPPGYRWPAAPFSYGDCTIVFWGECGYRFALILGEHKGNMYAWAVRLEDALEDARENPQED